MRIVVVGHYRPRYSLAYYFDWRDAFLAAPPPHEARLIDTYLPFRWPRPVFDALPPRWSMPTAAIRAVYAGEAACDLLVYAPSFFYFNRGRRRRFFQDVASRGRRGFTTVFFMENEYRLLEEKVAYANVLDAEVLVSQLPLDVAESLYRSAFRGKIVSCPAGLNPRIFTPTTPIGERVIDVGTRSHVYPASLGDSDRNALLAHFSSAPGPLQGLSIDISLRESDRLPREEWAGFLNRCKATVTTEAGASKVSCHGGPPLPGKAVSSRHFEAIGTKTALVMFRGRFNDLLRPGEHYIEVDRAFGNLVEVARALRDLDALQSLVDRAHEEALASHTYGHRVQALLRAV